MESALCRPFHFTTALQQQQLSRSSQSCSTIPERYLDWGSRILTSPSVGFRGGPPFVSEGWMKQFRGEILSQRASALNPLQERPWQLGLRTGQAAFKISCGLKPEAQSTENACHVPSRQPQPQIKQPRISLPSFLTFSGRTLSIATKYELLRIKHVDQVTIEGLNKTCLHTLTLLPNSGLDANEHYQDSTP